MKSSNHHVQALLSAALTYNGSANAEKRTVDALEAKG